MPKPERPSDLPSAAINAGALLLEALWIQEQRAALDRERLDLAMREAKLAREQAKLVMDRADLARERARHEADKPPPPSVSPVEATDGERVIVPTRITYAWCCKFRVLPRAMRMQVSRVRRSQFLRVARMGCDIGNPLDAANTAFRYIRWVAYGDGPVAQANRRDLILRGERPKSPPRPRRKRRRAPSDTARD